VSRGDYQNLRRGSQFTQHNYRLGSTLTWDRGVHQMKFGFQAQRDSLKQYNDAPHLNLNFFEGRVHGHMLVSVEVGGWNAAQLSTPCGE